MTSPHGATSCLAQSSFSAGSSLSQDHEASFYPVSHSVSIPVPPAGELLQRNASDLDSGHEGRMVGTAWQRQRLVRNFEKTAAGELFYKLVRPYVQTLVEAGQVGQARAVIDFLKKREVLDLGPNSIIGRDIRSLESKLGG